MRINTQQNISFKNRYSNMMLKSLEKISEYPTTFNTLVAFASAITLRPFVIKNTPKVEKENKNYAISNSIASGLVKLAIAEMIALPIERAVKNIDKNPQLFLKPETVRKFQGSLKSINQSQSYHFITQSIKLGANLLTAIPKALIAIPLLVMIKDKIFAKNEEVKPHTKTISFKGRVDNSVAKSIGKILDLKSVQNFAEKYQNMAKDISKYTIMLTDTLLCGAFVFFTNKNKKIDENRKKPLIYNNVISTVISVAGGFYIDKLIQKNTAKSVEKFINKNKTNSNLVKYVQGINILRPALIFAGIYYGIIPVISTFMAERFDKNFNKNQSSISPSQSINLPSGTTSV